MKKKKDHSEVPLSRRRLLKAIGGGTVAGATLLPGHWSKPIVDTVLLPAHAQTSGPCNVQCGFRVRLSWNNLGSTDADLDLEIQTPGGTRVAPKAENGVRAGQCLQHEGDAVAGPFAGDAEEIAGINDSFVGAGRYLIFVRNNSLVNANLQLTANVCEAEEFCTGGIDDATEWAAGSINVSIGGTAAINLNCPAI